MRHYVRNGGITGVKYRQLRADVWTEFEEMQAHHEIVHDYDIQLLAIRKAREMGLEGFKASSGWLHFFKLEHKIVGRHIDNVEAAKNFEERNLIAERIHNFRQNTIPKIISVYSTNKIYNADQTALQLEFSGGRTLAIKGAKKVIRRVQRVNAVTYSYTAHITLRADGQVPKQLAIVLYEPKGVPQGFGAECEKYKNLSINHSTSGWMTKQIISDWMEKFFLPSINDNSCLIIDAWKGYKDLFNMAEVEKKKLKIIALPEGTTSELQPCDTYFNRPFKHFMRTISQRIRWQFPIFTLGTRTNILNLLDLTWNQFRAERFLGFRSYCWYKAGIIQDRPDDFLTPYEFCLKLSEPFECSNGDCEEFASIRCAWCAEFFCFAHILPIEEHRH